MYIKKNIIKKEKMYAVVLPEQLKEEMEKHEEIKWGQFARSALEKYFTDNKHISSKVIIKAQRGTKRTYFYFKVSEDLYKKLKSSPLNKSLYLTNIIANELGINTLN